MMRKVSKEEFNKFINDSKHPLLEDVTGVCTPPLKSYNDFSNDKKWPESMVAYIVLNEQMEGNPSYNGEPNDYYIDTYRLD